MEHKDSNLCHGYRIVNQLATQAVTGRHPTAVVRVRLQVKSCGSCGKEVALGHVLSEYFGFTCQLSVHHMLHTHLLSGSVTVDVPGGLILTPSQTK